VRTSDVAGAGTDAGVWVVLFGEHGDSGEIRLQQSDTNRRPFSTGQTDVFTVADLLDLGRLVKCRVWHDNKGKRRVRISSLSVIVQASLVECSIYSNHIQWRRNYASN